MSTDTEALEATDVAEATTVDLAGFLGMTPEDRTAALAAEAENLAAYRASEDRSALADAIREATEALADYDANEPATPILDAANELRAQLAAVLGNPEPVKATSTRSDMDEAHARQWIKDHSTLAKWPAIQAYRGSGYSANTDRFFAIHAEVKAA